MVIVLALSFLRTSWALMTVFFLTYGLIAVAIVDAVLMWRRIKARLIAKFGVGKVPSGATMYAVMRAFQLRPDADAQAPGQARRLPLLAPHEPPQLR